MPFTKEQILAEIQKRGLQAPAPIAPQFSQEQIATEMQRRGLQPPVAQAAPTNGITPSFEGMEAFQEAYQPQLQPVGIAPGDIPTEEALAAPPLQPAAPEPTLAERGVGVAETALSLLSGAVGGSAGMLGGTIEGLYEAYKAGKLGTPEGTQMAEQIAMQRAGELTYEPRGEVGREYAAELGEALAPMQALGPQVAPRVPVAGRVGRRAGVQQPEAPVAPAREPVAPTAPAAPPVREPVLKRTPQELAESTRKAAEGGLGAERAKAILAEELAPDPAVVESARRLGVEEYLQPDHLSTNQQYREISQLVKSTPGSPARTAELRGLEQIARRADDVIGEAGGTEDWSTLRTDVKTRLENIQGELDTKAQGYYDQLRESIPANTPVATDNILNYTGTQAAELGGIKNLSPLERSVHNRLSPKDGKSPSYALLDRVRKDLTAARVKKQGEFKDADTGQIKKLERELLKDQQNVADQFGVREVFDNARQAVAIRKGVESDMASLFGKQLDASFITPLKTGVKKIAEGDVAKFKKTIEAVPEDMRPRVVATAMETAFGKNARRGDINFANYADWYEGAMKNKEAFNEVMKYLPKKAKQQFADLYKVSDGIRKSTREYIATGRGETLRQSLEGTDNLFKKLAGKAAPGVAETVAPGSGVLMAIGRSVTPKKAKGVEAIDKLMISPQFRAMVNERIKTGNSNPATVQKVARSKQFGNYIKAVGGIGTSPEAFLIEAMRPDENQEQPGV